MVFSRNLHKKRCIYMETDHSLSARKNPGLFAIWALLQKALNLHTLLQECLGCNTVFFKIKLVFGFWILFSFPSTEALSTSVEGRVLKGFLFTSNIALWVCLHGPLQFLFAFTQITSPFFTCSWQKPLNSVWYLMSLWQLQQLCV